MAHETSSDDSGDSGTERRDRDGDAADWFAMSAVRVALVLVGLVITVFALGQAVGVDLLGTFADALATQTGQWLLVSLLGIALIAIGSRVAAAR